MSPSTLQHSGLGPAVARCGPLWPAVAHCVPQLLFSGLLHRPAAKGTFCVLNAQFQEAAPRRHPHGARSRGAAGPASARSYPPLPAPARFCPLQGHTFLSVHQHFSPPPVAPVASSGLRGVQVFRRSIPRRSADEAPSRSSEPNRDRCPSKKKRPGGVWFHRETERGRWEVGGGGPFSSIASSHHPSIRPWPLRTTNAGQKGGGGSAPRSPETRSRRSYPSPTTTHLMACIVRQLKAFAEIRRSVFFQ